MEIMPALEDTSSATTRVHPPLTRHFLLHAPESRCWNCLSSLTLRSKALWNEEEKKERELSERQTE